MNIWEEIKDRYTCKDIANEYGVDLSKKKTVCPFCNYKKNPSFYVTDDYFICHHCQKKGDVFTLAAEFQETDRWGALKILCDRTGIKYTRSKQDEERENISQILKLFCEHFLIQDENSGPWKYLLSRGLTPDFIKKKLFGFIPDGLLFSSLPKTLKGSKFIKEKKLPAWLSGRILIPFWQGNQIVYLTGRALDEEDERKYLNIHGKKPWTGKMRGPELLVTEGPFDQLLAEQAGFNCIATAGSAGLIKIHKGIKKIFLCFDGNKEGREFTEKYALDFYEQGADVKICQLNEGTDLADFFSEGGIFDELEQVPIFEFYFEKLKEDTTNKEIKAKVYRVTKRFDDIERELAFKKLKTIYGVAIGVIRKDYYNSLQDNQDDFLDGGAKFNVPDGYLITRDGIYTGTMTQISFDPIYISRVGQNKQTGVEYVEIAYKINGQFKRRIVERSIIASIGDLIKESKFGAPVNSANAMNIINYLAAWIACNREVFPEFEVVNQLGWWGDYFILTDRIIADGVENVYYHGSIKKDAFSKKGTLENWLKEISKLKDLNSGQIVRFLFYAGFAALAWEYMNFSPVIIHLYSNTSKGKTTALRIVSSIYGNPNYSKAIITWDITDRAIIRLLEHLKNVPLFIDELTSKNMKNFQGVIYAISGGVSRGKASKIDPFDIIELRNFTTIVFSNGEPPMLSEQSFAGETVRVWELIGNPFGVDDECLINTIVEGINNNHGHAVELFVKNFLRLKDLFKSRESFLRSTETTELKNAELRVKKQFDVIYLTGLIINEIFKLNFPVKDDISAIFNMIRKQIKEKAINIEHILSEIASHVSINHINFPEVTKDENNKNIMDYDQKYQKRYGYLLKNEKGGHDLGIIRSYFIEWMNEKWNSKTGGLYILSLLREKHMIPDRYQPRIDGKRIDLVFFKNFFEPEAFALEKTNDTENPFG